jgi:type III secretion protein U
MLQAAAPLAGVAVVGYILASIIQTRGLIVSGKGLAPNFDRVSPVEGVKRIFGMRGLSEALKLLAKVLLLVAAVAIILRLMLNGLFWSPTCDEACVTQAAASVLGWTMAAALIVFLFIGLVDLRITDALFRRDHRMTESEMKRERREEYGAIEVRQRRRQIRAEAVNNPPIRGFGRATVVVRWGGGLVGLLYDRSVQDMPIVVGKLYGEEADKTYHEARAKGVPVIPDEQFLADLMNYGRVGEPIPKALVQATAAAFVKYGIVK